MPHYYNSQNETFGTIRVIPDEWYRKIFLLRWGDLSYWPYKVNDNIKFRVKVEKLKENGNYPYPLGTYILEKIGSEPLQINMQLTVNEAQITGKARHTGDTKFFLGSFVSITNPSLLSEKELVELFDEDVRSFNYYMFGWTGIVVTALLTGICSCCVGIFLALVAIRTVWQIWIPDWITRLIK